MEYWSEGGEGSLCKRIYVAIFITHDHLPYLLSRAYSRDFDLIFGMDKCDNNRMISTQYSILETVLAVRQARHAHVADNCFKFGLIWFWFALV